MRNPKIFLNKFQTASPYDRRLEIFIIEYRKHRYNFDRPLKVLDIGPGKNPQLLKHIDKNDKYYACDFYKEINQKAYKYVPIDLNEESIAVKFSKVQFDVIFCGEVIEHLFSPDDLLDDIKKLMHKDSILILSTPNLAYYVNRVLLLFGIFPLFLESSSKYKLGRRFKQFGQGNKTEGHIKVFTFGALKDLLKIKKFKIIKIIPVSIWEFWFDKFMYSISKGLAADNVFVLKK